VTTTMSAMQAYLAAKYMSGPKADAILARTSSKKKKRKANGPSTSTSGTIIRDEDVSWTETPADEEDDIKDAVVEKDRGFKRRRVEGGGNEAVAGGWATIREGAKETSPEPAADEKPQIVEEQTPLTGGLLTKAQLRQALGPKAPQKGELSEAERQAAQETIYRDATGRKIDMKAEKAEAAQKKREAEQKEAERMTWGRGLAQKEEQQKTKEMMERERQKGFARHADDEDLNEEQKSKEIWNDPAAAFLTKKRSKGPRKPQYAGPTPPPNRFGIKPGYRWDGVDRSNGFEKKMFQKLNDRKRLGVESYSWSVDDM